MMVRSRSKAITAVKGTRDILPEEVWKWQKTEATAKDIFELYGYREIRTPIFEDTELFKKGTGETSDIVIKEMYSFTDKGGRSLTLRPEYTPSVVRAIIDNNLNLKPQPMRFYFIGPMFRYDRPQKGRYRQFHQVDIEVFGEEDPAIDAEIVEMADSLLKRLDVVSTEILVNSVGCRECRPPYHKSLQKEAARNEDRFCADCKRKIGTNPLRIFDCKVKSCRELAETLPKISDFLCENCRSHFQSFLSHLNAYGIDFTVEPRLVRGIDYYTKTTFEIVTSRLGAQDAILGGGRYDEMMKDFGGPDICGIGFAMGVERLLEIVPSQNPARNFLFIAYLGDRAQEAGMTLARFFRRNGIETLIEYKGRSLKNQMARANKLGSSWALIVGEDEVNKELYQFKTMATGEQIQASEEEILKIIQKSLS